MKKEQKKRKAKRDERDIDSSPTSSCPAPPPPSAGPCTNRGSRRGACGSLRRAPRPRSACGGRPSPPTLRLRKKREIDQSKRLGSSKPEGRRFFSASTACRGHPQVLDTRMILLSETTKLLVTVKPQWKVGGWRLGEAQGDGQGEKMRQSWFGD